MTDLRTIAARLHAAYHLADVDPSHPIRLTHDALIAAADERDAIMRKHAIESDESLTECVERSIAGWEQRARKVEAERDALLQALNRPQAAKKPEPTPEWWRTGLAATLMREGVNKHRAREIADGYWQAYCQIPEVGEE